jgi:hypothetical protein
MQISANTGLMSQRLLGLIDDPTAHRCADAEREVQKAPPASSNAAGRFDPVRAYESGRRLHHQLATARRRTAEWVL